MRSHIFAMCFVFTGALVVLITMFAGDTLAQSDEDLLTLFKLKEQVAALEARVERLESQQTGVQQAAGVMPPIVTVPRTFDDTPESRLPNGWKRGDINGIPFYTLPLSIRSADQ